MEKAFPQNLRHERAADPEGPATEAAGARRFPPGAHRRLVSSQKNVPSAASPVSRFLHAQGLPAWQAGARREREMLLDSLSDTELLANSLAADDQEQAGIWVQELFRRHYPKVVAWCLRLTGDREDAYDLAQAIFTKAYRNLDSFRGESKISTWLYSITRSECMNFLKARSSRPPADGVDQLDELPDAAAVSPDQALERQGSARVVRALLDESLDDTEKKVFTLHYGDDVPLDAITRLLGLGNRSGAKAYIVSARRKLNRAVRLWKARERTEDGEGRLS